MSVCSQDAPKREEMLMLTPHPDLVKKRMAGIAAPHRLSVIDLARRRYSCRAYVPEPLAPEQRGQIEALLSSIDVGPLGAAVRFRLVAATEEDAGALRGLGTYGFIAGATAFVVGAVDRGDKNLEDFGYAMERVILGATALDLGTCWLGGSFTRSRFARSIGAATRESVPAVAAIGRAVTGSERGPIRRRLAADDRKPWSELFFDRALGTPLTPEQAGPFAPALEAVRLAPSASNKQPWRIVRQGKAWDFHLERTPGYGKRSLTFRLLRLADLQRVDMGIAMCHFELAARESGQSGRWMLRPSSLGLGGARPEYIVTWAEG